MGIARLKNLAGGGIRDYYNHGKDDYYQSEELEPEYVGSGTARFGQEGDFTVERFEALNLGHAGHERKAKDLTLSPPKSLSLMYALGDDRQRQDALEVHRQAVRITLGYIEQSGMLTTRVREGEHVINKQAGGMVVAVFEHATNRNQDPNLHSHCLIANACTAEGSDEITNLNYREIYRNQKHLGQVYDSALIQALNERGYSVQCKDKSFELDGITDDQIRTFSTRREDIRRSLNSKGKTYESATDDERQRACFETRRAKQVVDKVALSREWNERAQKAELDFSRPHALTQEFAHQEHTSEYIREALSECAELDGIFTAKAVYARAIAKARENGHGLSPQDMGEHYPNIALDAGVISLPDQEDATWLHHQVTTLGLVQAEFDLCERLEVHRCQLEPVMHKAEIEAGIVRFNAQLEEQKGYVLKDEQAEMVRHILSDQSLVSVIQGDAGTGKTTALSAVGSLFGTDKMIGLAIQSAAASNLQGETGIKSMNIDLFMSEIEAGKKPLLNKLRGGLIVVDEAAMVDSKKMEMITKVAEEYGARISLVGDTKQLAAVGAGKPMEMIMSRGLADTHNLKDIRRQKNEDHRAIVKEFANGKDIELAIAKLDELGLIKVHKTKEKRHEAIANEAIQDWANGSPSLVITSLNKDRESLNGKIRFGLQQKGILPAGKDQIVDLQDRRGRDVTRALTQGDRVVCNRNDKKLQIENGNTATVIDVHANSNTLRLKMDKDGRVKTINLNDYRAIDYAYALTTYTSQGQTVQKCIYEACSKSPLLSRNEFYVAISRHKDGLKIYTNNKDKMTKKIEPNQIALSTYEHFRKYNSENHNDTKRIKLKNKLQKIIEKTYPGATSDLAIQRKNQAKDFYTSITNNWHTESYIKSIKEQKSLGHLILSK